MSIEMLCSDSIALSYMDKDNSSTPEMVGEGGGGQYGFWKNCILTRFAMEIFYKVLKGFSKGQKRIV